ncbi:hypothetical protein GF325_17690 [Candidatus Bathyarchaeota archaeon]|nr:hypothetical protein [Candidatus Bathyarchaeota archaeon]
MRWRRGTVMIDGIKRDTPRGNINQARLDAIPDLDEVIYYFKGCTEKSYPGINTGFIEICKALDVDIKESTEQSCCAGNFLPFNVAPVESVVAITKRNYSVMEGYARKCVTTCNGCFSSFMQADHYYQDEPSIRQVTTKALESIGRDASSHVDVFHVGEYLYKHRAELPQILQESLAGIKVAVHYGCHFLRQEDPRVVLDDPENPSILEAILEQLEAKVVDYREKNLCCGAGLNQRMLHDDRINSLRVTNRKMKSIATHEPDMIVVICPYCLLHLDNAQLELEVAFDEEFDIPIIHLTELLGILLGIPVERLHLDTHEIPLDGILGKIRHE